MNGSPPPNFQENVRRQYGDLSPALHQVADYLLNNASSVPFLTIEQLASAIGVSPSTIVRFATTLGYKGFSHMHDEFQKFVRESLLPTKRLEQFAISGKRDPIDLSIKHDEENIQTLFRSLDRKEVHRTVELIETTDRIYLKGGRSSESIASFFGLCLSQIGFQTQMLNAQEALIPESVSHVNKESLLIAVSLPRYASSTIRLGRFFHERGARIALITDSIQSPLASICTSIILVSFESTSFFNSNVAALAAVNAILALLSQRHRGEIKKQLELDEEIWKYFKTHYIIV